VRLRDGEAGGMSGRRSRARARWSVPHDVLRPCPFCARWDDGLIEAELWRHLVASHSAIDRVARAVRELDAIGRVGEGES